MCADDQTVHMTESKQADALSLFIHRLTFSGTPCCSWGVCRGAKRMPWKAQGALNLGGNKRHLLFSLTSHWNGWLYLRNVGNKPQWCLWLCQWQKSQISSYRTVVDADSSLLLALSPWYRGYGGYRLPLDVVIHAPVKRHRHYRIANSCRKYFENWISV